jgi:hypothetical protein
MKLIKSAAFACSVALATGAFADAGNTLITFSTQADTYADGTSVKDGEWYALCWSPNETFGGITADSKPAAAGDEIYLMAPLAKNGRCPTTVFQLDSKVAPTTGNYFVYMLDTRTATGDLAAAVDGKPVAASAQNKATASAATSERTITVKTGTETAASGFTETAVPAGAGNPVIEKFDLVGTKARIVVSGMHPALQYNVKAGATVDKIETLNDRPLQGDADGVTFEVDKDLGNFFKVVRQPLETQD